jgi:hypothetical protein
MTTDLLTDILLTDIKNRFKFHPGTEDSIPRHEEIRDSALMMAEDILSWVPEGREKSLALTRLEEAIFWANAGIARIGVDGERR